MGSSRASTPAGRRRAARRAGDGGRRTASEPSSQRNGSRKPRASSSSGSRKPAPKKQAARKRPTRGPTKASSHRPRRKRAVAKASRPGARSLFRPASLVTVLALIACAAAGYQFWLRDSSLVAIEEVQVEGAGGPERKQIVAALTEAAAGMTTLHVREDELNAAVRGFPTVIGVDADADFPHGLTIAVSEREPVLIARSGGEKVPVAGDGTMLAGVDVKAKLPVIEVETLAPSGRLEGSVLDLARVAGAAPEPLRRLITDLRADEEGLEVTLQGDIPVRFGGADRAEDAWAAAAAVLADQSISSVTYVDVRVPERPAVGGASPGVSEETTIVLDEEAAPFP